MRFQFEEQSELYGRILRKRIDRFSFVSHNERGLAEYIFCYKKRIPTRKQEPDLFRGANVAEKEDNVLLTYEDINEEVILTTLKADDRFREEHLDIVSQNESFRIDN